MKQPRDIAQPIHTIFGAGQVGLRLAKHLAAAGVQVRLVRRSEAGEAIDGVTWLRGDGCSDAAFANEACRGATTVYNCANPADYHRWDGVLQPLYRSIRRAAGDAGARLVQLDNLYMVGRPTETPFDEGVALNPCSSKGELRKLLHEELMDAHQRGEVEAVVARASDFFGADTPNGAVFRPDTFKSIAAGGTVWAMGNPDMPHSYSYVPDVVRGLAVLGSHPAAAGRVWHLPTSAQLTTRELIEAFAAQCGTTVTVRSVPTWLLRVVGVVIGLARAIAEMAYQWEVPYLIDDGAFARTFGITATPLAQAIAETTASELGRPALLAASDVHVAA